MLEAIFIQVEIDLGDGEEKRLRSIIIIIIIRTIENDC